MNSTLQLWNNYPGKGETAARLVREKVASRIAKGDSSVFSFSAEAQDFAERFTGWTHLASQPIADFDAIVDFAIKIRNRGLKRVILIGQGGSTQAAMTVTKLNDPNKTGVEFSTMDMLSPLYVRQILAKTPMEHTLFIVSSKSGTTLETTCIANVCWKYVADELGEENVGEHFVAITDPGTALEEIAKKHNFLACFHSPVNVGGRFSALTTFTLLPAALVGIDIRRWLYEAVPFEHACGEDSLENPAIQLAGFLYDCYKHGRNKVSLFSPQPGRVFGLWVEQLIAESLGKEVKGILPQIEIDAHLLSRNYKDRSLIIYRIYEDDTFPLELAHISSHIPTLEFCLNDVYKLSSYFLIWEYATTFLGYLLKVNPFDQPDVQATKTSTRLLLEELMSHGGSKKNSAFKATSDGTLFAKSDFDVDQNSIIDDELDSLDHALEAFFRTLHRGNYFVFAAYLPFTGEARRKQLEIIRNEVANRISIPACLEIGPRYLHSTGQLYKGGFEGGSYLIVSSDEQNDLQVPGRGFSLGDVQMCEAHGDFIALKSRNRNVMHVHLKGNSPEELKCLADRVCAAIDRALM